MTATKVALILVPAMLVATAAGVGVGVRYKDQVVAGWQRMAATNSGADTQPSDTLYTCSMHRQVIQDHPGDCPMCHMKLVPMNTLAGGEGQVTVDPAVVQNMGVRTAAVQEGAISQKIRAVGSLLEPEQAHFDVNLRVSGWIQKLHANQEGMQVHKGDPLFEIYSPEITAAADELIAARKSLSTLPKEGADPVMARSAEAMMAAGRRKLELLGLTAEQVEGLAKLDKAPPAVTITSPMHGHIARKNVIEGSQVTAGQRLMEIADRSHMWMQAQVYEQQIGLIKEGQKVLVKVQAFPGKTFEGTVDFIYPHLDPATRTAMVRVTLPNPEHTLHENMYATAEFDTASGTKSLLVPREAVIDSGVRQIVFVEEGEGHFAAKQVKVGRSGRMPAADGQEVAMVEILSGLEPSARVVTSGQFLLDSESRLQEAVQKMLREKSGMAGAGKSGKATEGAHPKVDALLAAYLPLADFFGKMQERDTPADVKGMLKAAGALAEERDAGLKRWGEQVLAKAKAMEGAPIDAQRAAFKEISQIVVKLTRERQVSAAVGPIFTYVCPMDDAGWLQANKEMANPFFAREMKTCGEMTGELKLVDGGVR